MSVINQMLQGLDKSAQQQVKPEQSGAVIVAEPRNNTVFIGLLIAIVSVALVGAYLFVKKQNVGSVADIAQEQTTQEKQTYAVAPLTRVEPVVIEESKAISEESITADLLDKPALVVPVKKQEIAVSSPAEQTVSKPVAKAVQASVAASSPVTIPTAIVEPPKPATPVKKNVPQKKSVEQSAIAAKTVEPKVEKAVAENTISIKAITRTPAEQAQLYAKQAEAALLAGDKENAKSLFNKVLRFDKNHDISREKLAALLYGEQRTQSAVNLLQEGLSLSPDYSNFRLMLARIYLQKNNKQQAYYYLKPHQPDVAGNLDYYAILAGLAQTLNDLDTALIAYKKLTQHDPNRAKWWLGLGITADKAKQVQLALSAYNTAQNMGQLSASSRNYINARIAQLEKQ